MRPGEDPAVRREARARTGPRASWAAVAALALVACAGHRRLEQVQALSPEGKELFAKYKQFLTESQKDELLSLPSDDARRRTRYRRRISAPGRQEEILQLTLVMADGRWQTAVELNFS